MAKSQATSASDVLKALEGDNLSAADIKEIVKAARKADREQAKRERERLEKLDTEAKIQFAEDMIRVSGANIDQIEPGQVGPMLANIKDRILSRSQDQSVQHQREAELPQHEVAPQNF